MGSRCGKSIRDSETGRTVPDPEHLARLAHRMRYSGGQSFSKGDLMLAATGLDTLLCLVGAVRAYGRKQGDSFRGAVLDLMATEPDESEG